MILAGFPFTVPHVETLSDGCGVASLKMADGDFRMNKEADLENVPGESVAPLLPSCLFWMIPLASSLFALACGTPPLPAVSAGELLLLYKGQPVTVDDEHWKEALYYHENDNATPYNGIIEATYTNGSPRMQGKVRNGRLEGPSIVWYEGGGQDRTKERLNIVYKFGRICSYKEYYEENGTLKMDLYADAEKLSKLEFGGTFTLRDSDGLPIAFSGTAIEQWPDGCLKKQEAFMGGQHHGSSEWWHENGKQWYSATYENGFPVGKVEAWRPDGTREYVYTWTDGLPSSKITYAPDGVTESGRVGEDEKGTLIYYHPNGQKKLEEVYEGNILAPAKKIWYDESGLRINPPSNPPGIPSPSNPGN
ncbi:MAG: hypothetical protein QF685_00135 [Verrucomicrobiota bacterium]|nr:hypothetical protein [Verrucomicrobiota bacterium]